jgi:hypothetical protein
MHDQRIPFAGSFEKLTTVSITRFSSKPFIVGNSGSEHMRRARDSLTGRLPGGRPQSA